MALPRLGAVSEIIETNIIETNTDQTEFQKMRKSYIKERAATTPDTLLSAFANVVQNADDEDLGIGVTLTVGGSIVSGEAISRIRWMEEQVDAGVSILGPLLDEMIANRELPDDERAPGYERHIHLRKARYWGSSGPLTNNDMYWRGRLAEVDGWSLGVLLRQREE